MPEFNAKNPVSKVADIDLSVLNTRLREASDRYRDVGGVDLKAFPLADYAALIEKYAQHVSYDYINIEVATQALLIKHKYGTRGLTCYHAMLLIHLIERNTPILLDSRVPIGVKNLSVENFERILDVLIAGDSALEQSAEFQPPQYLHYRSDRFFKDLSAATLRLHVYGCRKICRVDFPRGLLKSHPIKMTKLIAKHGFSGVYLESHFDSNDQNLKARFSEDSWRQTLMDAGQTMQEDPNIAGFLGHAWYFDPSLSAVAPQLAYIHATIAENGGYLFCTGITESTTETALRNSTVRQGLYELGLYQPKRFKAVWPRKALLNWIAKQ